MFVEQFHIQHAWPAIVANYHVSKILSLIVPQVVTTDVVVSNIVEDITKERGVVVPIALAPVTKRDLTFAQGQFWLSSENINEPKGVDDLASTKQWPAKSHFSQDKRDGMRVH
jgi:hypothetical protein